MSQPPAPASPPQSLAIHVLGGFTVRVAGHLVPDDAWALRKAASLVKLLVLAPQPHLDCKHTGFGQVSAGLDVMQNLEIGDEIKSVKFTGH